jgi:hypothetical protein
MPWLGLTGIAILQVLAVVQTSVTLAGLHVGVGEKTDLLTPNEANNALKVPKFLSSQPYADS